MTITLSKDKRGFIHLKSKNPWFEKEYFGDVKIDIFDLFFLMRDISERAYDEVGEECFFDIIK